MANSPKKRKNADNLAPQIAPNDADYQAISQSVAEAEKLNEKLNKTRAKYNHALAVSLFVLSILSSITTLILGLTIGLTWYMIPVVVLDILLYVLFFVELRKMVITDEGIDKWCRVLLAKNPNYNRDNLPTVQSVQASLISRFSYWARDFRVSATKVIVCILLPVSVLCAVAGVITPVFTGNIGGNVTVRGTYISTKIDSNISTSYEFVSKDKCKVGYYNHSTHTYSYPQTITYSVSGKAINVGGVILTYTERGTKLVGANGECFMRV